MTASEISTLLAYYSTGHPASIRLQKPPVRYFYQRLVKPQMRSYLLVSYNGFIELLPRQAALLHVLTKHLALTNKLTDYYFIDSKKLPLWANQRIPSYRVFTHIASRGNSSTGWFQSLKLHLVINELGQLMNYLLTPASVADNNSEMLGRLLSGLLGRCYASNELALQALGGLLSAGSAADHQSAQQHEEPAKWMINCA